MNLAAARKHEGACGAAFDNPELIVAAVVGDGEAETGPLTTSWHVNKGPIRDGAVLPVLQGYKINNPTLLSRISRDELVVEGSDPQSMHQAMAAGTEHCVCEIRQHRQEARKRGVAERIRWPMIVLRALNGWTAPKAPIGRDGTQPTCQFRPRKSAF